ncbi:hypothetical protein [Leptolyngbya iicbica]|uniref:Uncharacterized protein n=2 Tax=Cyanophyceae TaxID=3028117 RepID=A0A4Q7EA13_9CYAN|nr:hypothetical protein [Leptolyngbya sp. LK]RZM77845.1 hypothetical protein DYY88_14850 [Leptolyngbya sp. LK]
MTLPPNDHPDDRLVDFLQRHRSEPPPAAPQLEAQVMAALAPLPPPPAIASRRRWALPAIAAALVLVGGSWMAWRSTGPGWQMAAESEVELEVDDFLAETWYASAYGDEVRLPLDTTQPDWLVSVYATPY